uniref:Acylamino-acid-releasing enzyme n=1 Tax=Daphnia galeata TaxID=27404 RepID=A0A8J2WSA9_9CRUS|nr:unnamed protein product [Daphnia galeata]
MGLITRNKRFHPSLLTGVGIVQQIETETTKSYQGMYNQSFPDRCWSPDGKLTFFTTPCKSSVQTYALNWESFKICKLSLPNGCTGSVVLDVFEDWILVCGVSLTRPDQIFIGHKPGAYPMDMPDSLTGNKELPSTQSLVADVVSFKVEGDMEYEASLIFPKNPSKKTPLVVAPHGDPHSVSTDQFNAEAYFFCQLGYAVLLVNYRDRGRDRGSRD